MLSTGSVLADRYQVEELLGRGNLGDVYRALDLETGAVLALKVLRADLAEDPELARRLRRVVPALARLDHPEIVQTYAFERAQPADSPAGAAAGTMAAGARAKGALAFLVMEYVPGTTLRRQLLEAGGPLPRAEAGEILRQVAAALDYAHGQGVIHGDVKPGNILLVDGTARLTDFALTAALQEAAVTAVPAGTPAYMSPEQLAGRTLDPRTDIYSLAVVLYEMVTGERPFTGESGAGITTRERLEDEHLNYEPADPRLLAPDLPPLAAAVILRGLAKSPRDRWPDAGTMADAWAAALGLPGRDAAAADIPLASWPGTAAAVPAAAAAMPPVLAREDAGAALWSPARRWLANASARVSGGGAEAPHPWAAVGGVLLVGLVALAVLIAWQLFVRGADRQPVMAAGFPALTPYNTAPPPAAAALVATATPLPATAMPTLTPTPTQAPTAAGNGGSILPNWWPGRGPVWTPPALATASPAPAPPSATAPPGPSAEVQAAVANIRSGPGTSYAPIAQLPQGTQLLITGRNAAGDWWQICCVQGGRGWIFASLVTTAGNVASIPVVEGTGSEAPAPAPTGTRVPPVATAAPAAATATPPPSPTTVPTATATASPAATDTLAATGTVLALCPSALGGSFAGLPAASDLTGCPVGAPPTTHYSHQYFEHGQMIYRYDLRSIYVLYADNTWAVYEDTYIEGQSEQLQSFSPPPGLLQPIKGFDRVWERPEVRLKLGWATRAEMGVIPGEEQDFTRAAALWLNTPGYLTRYFVLYAGGNWAEY